MPTLFPDYEQFLQKFTESKGIIEAVPSANLENISFLSIFFKVEPDGEINVIASYDKH